MPDLHPPRTDAFKVGFAQRHVAHVLDYEGLPHHVERDLRDVLAVLNAADHDETCTAYGYPSGRCTLPTAHHGPHEIGATA